MYRMKRHNHSSNKRPYEFPKPERPAEVPGNPKPDAPILPPEKPEIIPPEKPEQMPPPDMPGVGDSTIFKIRL